MAPRYFEIIVSGRQLAAFVGLVAFLVLAVFGLGVVVGLQQPETRPAEPVVASELPPLSPTTPAWEQVPPPLPVVTAPTPTAVSAVSEPFPVPTPTPFPAPTATPPSVPTATVPPPVPTPTRQAALPVPASGRWVQVAALSRREQAEGLRTRVIAAGFTPGQVVVLPEAAGKFRVRLGPFPDEESAQRVAARLKAGDFPGAFVVRE